MASTIWKSDAGRERLEKWYEHFQSKIAGEVCSLSVPTRFGTTHVLQAGIPDGPPLICLHAMRTGASFLLSELGPVLKRFRVIAPDLPTQSVRGLDLKLKLTDDSHAAWLLDIQDHFQLDQCNLFGVSWGGFVARLAANENPDRFNKLALLVPAGIANGSHWTGMMKMAFPLIKYSLRPSEPNLKNLLDPLLTTWDEDWANFIACSLKDMKFDRRIPPLAKDQDLQSLSQPTLVLAAKQDISFPGDAVINRAKKLIRKIETELMAECKHCPPMTEAFRSWLGDRLTRFFYK